MKSRITRVGIQPAYRRTKAVWGRCFMRPRHLLAVSAVVIGIFSGCSGSNSPSVPLAPAIPPGTPLVATPRITSLNGDYDPNHAQEVYVHPGDVVTLTADLIDPRNGFRAQGDAVEDFIWSASDSVTDACDAASDDGCLAGSNFQTTDYGVVYYVPYNLGDFIQITVRSHNPASVDANGNPLFDTVILRNSAL